MNSSILKQAIKISFIGVFLQLASACAPTVNVAKLNGVNKLAVVGYTATVEQEENSIDLNAITQQDQKKGNAILAYKHLTSSLGEHLKWEVIPYEDLIANADYQTLFYETQQGSSLASLQSAMASLSSDYHPEGIIWALRADTLSQSQRDLLLDALGVDAIASARVYIRPKSSGVLFFKTSTSYSAQVAFRVWSRGEDKEIWKDLMAQGEESETGAGIQLSIGGISVSSQDQKAYLQAVKLGYMALLERYDEARKKAESEAQVN